ncbi:winged helix-turn-helix transcriptional regulator [Romeria aff. gracilis LEGE 07310]|uniref:Winged helix-turn-helix transcriptional regulator n=1 Tax=Vasconcelosia minhoensis LEGE 07310 TaxID=915328 RepID=A0A8J7AX85_9CYAN|nr:metalloregulator ArsR/SmtB family transcription factor [Romeria gracilis]MBE9077682.1 winged helix-turn-helix transcriptional regulator [Romeria aff. gracilis LEGE 07310]
MPKPLTSETVFSGFHALSEPIRLQVLELLQGGELCVGDMCQKLNIAQSKLSFHLKTLKEASLVRARQQGRWMYYSLNTDQFNLLENYLANYGQMSQYSAEKPALIDY